MLSRDVIPIPQLKKWEKLRCLTLSRRRPLSYRPFLYDNGLRLERVNKFLSSKHFPEASLVPSLPVTNSMKRSAKIRNFYYFQGPH